MMGDRTLLPLVNARHPSAVDREWSGEWVAVGFAEQLPEVGDLLPSTIGWHGVHVRRLDDGSLRASLNARPFGGCFAVPSHCASTQNITCAHLGCAFSKDPDVLTSANDPDGRGRRQFVGDRPDRAVDLPVRSLGSLVFANVTTGTQVAWDPRRIATGRWHDQIVGRVAGPVRAYAADVPWTDSSTWVAARVERALGPRAAVQALHPNVTVVDLHGSVWAFVARPDGSTRSSVRMAALIGADQRADPDGSSEALARAMAGDES